MANHLVWIPGPQRAMLGPVPDDIELAEIPDDPLSDPRISEVEFLVPRMGANYREVIPAMPSLKVIQTISAGVDSIIASVPDHLTLCCARGANDAAVSEWTMTAILTGLHHFGELRDEQAAGRWSRQIATLLRDTTVLFVGYGAIAQYTEGLLRAFGPKILRVARRAREGVADYSQLEALLPEADVVILLLPLTDETRKLVDEQFLATMRDGALLINAARGAIVDTDALLAALHAHHITAVLDVTDPEPLPEGHPLFSAPGVFITPHIAGITKQGPVAAFKIVTEQLWRYSAGEPLLHVVTDGY